MFARQLLLELHKLFTRKRTFMGFGVFLTAELLILFLFHAKSAQKFFAKILEQNGFGFEEYFSGLSFAFLMVSQTAFLLGSLYLALVSGDMIAKEVEDGTMRMLLSRPVSRLRVLLVKYLACVVYSIALMLFIVGSSLVAGILSEGWGGLFVFAPLEGVFGIYEAGPGMVRFLYAAGLLSLLTLSISTLGFMFSCCNMKPASATILTLSIIITDFVLHLIPQFKFIQEYLLTQNMGAWMQVFQPRIPWERILESVVYLGAFNLTFLLLGALVFNSRDFKS